MASNWFLSAPVEAGDSDQFPYFAKRSKEVSRDPRGVFSVSGQRDEPVWGADAHLPSSGKPFTFEPAFSAPPAGRVNSAGKMMFEQEKLPHPSQLISRRKRNYRSLGGATEFHKHLKELKTKQHHVNVSKEGRWGLSSAPSRPEDSGASQMFASDHHLPSDVTWMKSFQALSVTHQFLTGSDELNHFAPGGNPLMSFIPGKDQTWFSSADTPLAFSFANPEE